MMAIGGAAPDPQQVYLFLYTIQGGQVNVILGRKSIYDPSYLTAPTHAVNAGGEWSICNYPAMWVVPGGGFERPQGDNTALDTAVREAREELWIPEGVLRGLATAVNTRELGGGGPRRWAPGAFAVYVHVTPQQLQVLLNYSNGAAPGGAGTEELRGDPAQIVLVDNAIGMVQRVIDLTARHPIGLSHDLQEQLNRLRNRDFKALTPIFPPAAGQGAADRVRYLAGRVRKAQREAPNGWLANMLRYLRDNP